MGTLTVERTCTAYLFKDGEFVGTAILSVEALMDQQPKDMIRAALVEQKLSPLEYDVFVPRHPHYLNQPIHLKRGI